MAEPLKLWDVFMRSVAFETGYRLEWVACERGPFEPIIPPKGYVRAPNYVGSYPAYTADDAIKTARTWHRKPKR